MKVEFNKETESLKKTKTEIKLEMNNLGSQTENSKVSLTHREYKTWKKESQALKTRY